MGQDIYDGEVGINEWFRCGIEECQDWELFYSPEIYSQSEDKGVDKEEDATRDSAYYDAIYQYLLSCGIQPL